MWQNLVNVLQELTDDYEELLALGKKKNQVLILVDLKALEPVLQKEQQLAQNIHKAEECRKGILKKLSATEKRICPETRMRELYGYSPLAYQEQLVSLHERLNAVIAKVSELREQNELLITSALSAVHYHLNRMGGSVVEPAYGGKGQEVVSRTKKFDFHA